MSTVGDLLHVCMLTGRSSPGSSRSHILRRVAIVLGSAFSQSKRSISRPVISSASTHATVVVTYIHRICAPRKLPLAHSHRSWPEDLPPHAPYNSGSFSYGQSFSLDITHELTQYTSNGMPTSRTQFHPLLPLESRRSSLPLTCSGRERLMAFKLITLTKPKRRAKVIDF